jgi:hypothetical protein
MLTPQFDRMCDNCRMVRVPEVRYVSKRGKKWKIFTCRVCKRQDIEAVLPGSYFFPETGIDEIDAPEEPDNF